MSEPSGSSEPSRGKRRRRRPRHGGQDAGAAGAGAPTPRPTPTGNAGASGKRRKRSATSKADSPERALRDLVGAGPSQVGVSGALRARDVNRPTEQDLAEAEREVVIVRRYWKPTSPRPDNTNPSGGVPGRG